MLDTAYQRPRRAARLSSSRHRNAYSTSASTSRSTAQPSKRSTKSRPRLSRMLESRLVYVKPALFQQEQGFRSVLPHRHRRARLSIQSSILRRSPSIFPFISFDLTSDKGILYGINRHNASRSCSSIASRLENYNSVTFAKSGSGKTYTTKLEILRTLMFDTEVIVIDPEREYEYLAADRRRPLLQHLALTPSTTSIPFDLADPARGRIAGRRPAQQHHHVGRAVPHHARRTYAGGRRYHRQSDHRNVRAQGHHGRRKFCRDRAAASLRLRARARGHGGERVAGAALKQIHQRHVVGLYQPPTNVDMNKKLVVFSVRDMEDDLKPVAMYIITHYIWNAVRKNLQKAPARHRRGVVDDEELKTPRRSSLAWPSAAANIILGSGDHHPGRLRLFKLAVRHADDNQLIDPIIAQAITDLDRQLAKDLQTFRRREISCSSKATWAKGSSLRASSMWPSKSSPHTPKTR